MDGEPDKSDCPNCGSAQRYTNTGYCPQCGKVTKKESSMNFAQREAALLAAMAKAPQAEQRALVAELDALRAEHTASIQADRDFDVASATVAERLTPVLAYGHHTSDTDWLVEIPTSTLPREVTTRMAAVATQWYRNLHEAIKAEPDELAEQAKGVARREAGRYGEQADLAAGAFYDAVINLVARDTSTPRSRVAKALGFTPEFTKAAATYDTGTCANCGEPIMSIGVDSDGKEHWIHEPTNDPRAPIGSEQCTGDSWGEFARPSTTAARKTAAWTEAELANWEQGAVLAEIAYWKNLVGDADMGPQAEAYLRVIERVRPDAWSAWHDSRPSDPAPFTGSRTTAAVPEPGYGTLKDGTPAAYGMTAYEVQSGDTTSGPVRITGVAGPFLLYVTDGETGPGVGRVVRTQDLVTDPNYKAVLDQQHGASRKVANAINDQMRQTASDRPKKPTFRQVKCESCGSGFTTSVFGGKAAESKCESCRSKTSSRKVATDGDFHVGRVKGASSLEQVQAYLPSNYTAHQVEDGTIYVQGYDQAGWTWEDYVKPRFLSGLMGIEDVTNEGQGQTWASRRTAFENPFAPCPECSGSVTQHAPGCPASGPKSGVPEDLFPGGGVPLRGDLTPEQEKWLKSRGSIEHEPRSASLKTAKSLEQQAYDLGRRGYASGRPADSPEDINGILGMGAPADQVESLYYDHYVRGYNDAYHNSLSASRRIAEQADLVDYDSEKGDLKQRLLSGEITREEYDRLRQEQKDRLLGRTAEQAGEATVDHEQSGQAVTTLTDVSPSAPETLDPINPGPDAPVGTGAADVASVPTPGSSVADYPAPPGDTHEGALAARRSNFRATVQANLLRNQG